MIKIGAKAPKFKDILCWLNTDITSFEELEGKACYIEFWDHTSANSIESTAFTSKLWETYHGGDCAVIGVHSPEYEFERYRENLESAIKRYGIRYPVAQDNNISTWLAYGNRFIPKQYVVSKNGTILYEHIGTGNERTLEEYLRQALDKDEGMLPVPLWQKSSGKLPILDSVTPEYYFGSRPIMSVKHPISYDKLSQYDPNDDAFSKREFRISGEWVQYEEYVELDTNKDSTLTFPFYAKESYVVFGTYGMPPIIEIRLDNRPLKEYEAGHDIKWDSDGKSIVIVDFSGLYHLISLSSHGSHELTIIPRMEGAQIYSVSFK